MAGLQYKPQAKSYASRNFWPAERRKEEKKEENANEYSTIMRFAGGSGTTT